MSPKLCFHGIKKTSSLLSLNTSQLDIPTYLFNEGFSVLGVYFFFGGGSKYLLRSYIVSRVNNPYKQAYNPSDPVIFRPCHTAPPVAGAGGPPTAPVPHGGPGSHGRRLASDARNASFNNTMAIWPAIQRIFFHPLSTYKDSSVRKSMHQHVQLPKMKVCVPPKTSSVGRYFQWHTYNHTAHMIGVPTSISCQEKEGNG